MIFLHYRRFFCGGCLISSEIHVFNEVLRFFCGSVYLPHLNCNPNVFKTTVNAIVLYFMMRKWHTPYVKNGIIDLLGCNERFGNASQVKIVQMKSHCSSPTQALEEACQPRVKRLSMWMRDIYLLTKKQMSRIHFKKNLRWNLLTLGWRKDDSN